MFLYPDIDLCLRGEEVHEVHEVHHAAARLPPAGPGHPEDMALCVPVPPLSGSYRIW